MATFWLTVAAVLLFGASLAEAQRAPTAPPGDVYSSSGNCQLANQQAVAQINAEHSREWPACHGDSACIRAANAKKAAALQAEGQKLRLCQASTGTPPATSNPPSGQPAIAPGFRPGRPNTWKPQDVTWQGKKWAVYTDAKGQPWRFKPEFTDDASSKWILDRSTIKGDSTYAGRKVPTATYRQRDMLGGPTAAYMDQPGYEIENFAYAR